MKLVPCQRFSPAEQQAVGMGFELSVANLKRAAACTERQQPSHGVLQTVEVSQLLSQQKHPSAFGIDGLPAGESPQRLEAGPAATDAFSVLLRKPSGNDQSSGLLRYRFVGQRAPRQHGHAHAFQKLAGFRITEVKGFIARHRHWPCWTTALWNVAQGIGSADRGIQQGNQLVQGKVLFRQPSPTVKALPQILQFVGRSESQMPALQGQIIAFGKTSQQRHANGIEHLLQQDPMTIAVDTVQHNSGKNQLGVVIPKAPDQSGERCRLTTGIHHQHNGQLELLRHRRGAALFRASNPIEEAHDPFHKGQISLRPIAVERPLDPAFSAEVDVEVAAGTACRCAQQLGIEVVGPDLERLNRMTMDPCPGQQGKGEQCFCRCRWRGQR